ncbi:hypothetical protein DUNSADRAFT_14682 [Dunaliella salina]|uniref:Uncharacterized protein n=1 Tax=Dunaliella salina TaxID=3046 RepID=A0ABQ7G711_DUNSA|nr:hypothetical protein DUNSADRAFT_14682 [Dunaliella salina]|eukprot:KAF5830369.1 hypothetical protein DUNSADRAFT_14682 [Dunaliella salina]
MSQVLETCGDAQSQHLEALRQRLIEISQCCNTAADLSEHFEKSYPSEFQG